MTEITLTPLSNVEFLNGLRRKLVCGIDWFVGHIMWH